MMQGRLSSFRPSRAAHAAAWAIVLAVNATGAFGGESDCGPLENAFGPHDYRFVRGEPLYLVESTHFQPYVEALVRTRHGNALGSELDYTLRAFPNHHRALVSMMRLAEKVKKKMPEGARYPVECWFDRALRFKPDDTVARMIYVTYLTREGRAADALTELERATRTAGDNAYSHFNIGMLYFDLGKHDLALAQAHKAMALGFVKPELIDRLKGVGKWTEPSLPAAAEAASVPASAP